MMTENEIHDLLSDYLDGRLDKPTAQAVEEGLRRYPAAKRAMAEMQGAVKLLNALPRVAPPADMRRTLSQKAARQVRLSKAGRRMLSSHARLVLFNRLLPVAAVLAVSCLAGLAVWKVQQKVESPAVALNPDAPSLRNTAPADVPVAELPELPDLPAPAGKDEAAYTNGAPSAEGDADLVIKVKKPQPARNSLRNGYAADPQWRAERQLLQQPAPGKGGQGGLNNAGELAQLEKSRELKNAAAEGPGRGAASGKPAAGAAAAEPQIALADRNAKQAAGVDKLERALEEKGKDSPAPARPADSRAKDLDQAEGADKAAQVAGAPKAERAAGEARFGGAVMVSGDPVKVYALMREALVGLEKKGLIRWSAPPEKLRRGQLPSLTVTTDDPQVIMDVLAVLPKSPDVTGIDYAPSRDVVAARRAQLAGAENLHKGFGGGEALAAKIARGDNGEEAGAAARPAPNAPAKSRPTGGIAGVAGGKTGGDPKATAPGAAPRPAATLALNKTPGEAGAPPATHGPVNRLPAAPPAERDGQAVALLNNGGKPGTPKVGEISGRGNGVGGGAGAAPVAPPAPATAPTAGPAIGGDAGNAQFKLADALREAKAKELKEAETAEAAQKRNIAPAGPAGQAAQGQSNTNAASLADAEQAKKLGTGEDAADAQRAFARTRGRSTGGRDEIRRQSEVVKEQLLALFEADARKRVEELRDEAAAAPGHRAEARKAPSDAPDAAGAAQGSAQGSAQGAPAPGAPAAAAPGAKADEQQKNDDRNDDKRQAAADPLKGEKKNLPAADGRAFGDGKPADGKSGDAKSDKPAEVRSFWGAITESKAPADPKAATKAKPNFVLKLAPAQSAPSSAGQPRRPVTVWITFQSAPAAGNANNVNNGVNGKDAKDGK